MPPERTEDIARDMGVCGALGMERAGGCAVCCASIAIVAWRLVARLRAWGLEVVATVRRWEVVQRKCAEAGRPKESAVGRGLPTKSPTKVAKPDSPLH